MDELEQIKAKINIVDFINEYVPLKKAGRNFKACCPFHSEKTPSFVVSPDRQIWHCFGSCGEGGDIFRFLMKWESLEFPEALRILAKRAGVRLREYVSSDLSRQKERLYEINHLAAEFYHYLLLNHPSGKKALDYILGRGISRNSLELFKIGWAPNLWEGVSKFLIGKKGYKMADLNSAGLVVAGERGYYDRFRSRLIFTLKNHRGEIVGFAGRTLDKDAKEAKYINTPETSLYIKGNILYGLDLTREAIKKENLAILVEGEIDLIQAYQAGTQNVVAVKGSALTEGQVNLLKRYSENVALALDTDSAGDAAARRGIEIADRAGLNVRVIRLIGGKDPDECIRKDLKGWFGALKKATPFYDFLIDSAFERFGSESAEGKKKIGEEILPVLASITNEIVKAHYIKKLAQKLDLSEEVILSAMAKVGKSEGKRETVEKRKEDKFPREEVLESYLLSLILQSPDPKETLDHLSSFFEGKDPAEVFCSPVYKKIFVSLADYFESSRNKQAYLKKPKEGEAAFKISDFIASCPKELIETIDLLYLADLGSVSEDEEFLGKELTKLTKEIKILILKRDLKNLAEKIRAAVSDKEIDDLIDQFKKTSDQLKTLN